MTGYGNYEWRSRDAGFDFHFLKPFDSQQPAAAIGAAARVADEGNP